MSAKGFRIAISGKGGVGKTMLAALLVRNLSKVGSVLAIDADPDANLASALGVKVKKTVGQVREFIIEASPRSLAGTDKASALEMALHDIVVETEGFDILVMGRSEGPGCYCAINNIVRQVIDYKANSYDFTVLDCEAGLEHLSRRTSQDMDLMIVVTEPTLNGILTARMVHELASELSISFLEIVVVANKVTPETKPAVERLAQENGLKIAAYIPYDPQVSRLDVLGEPIIKLPEAAPASQAVKDFCSWITEKSLILK